MPRGISVTYELRNDTGLVDVVVATHRIERVAAVVQPIGVAGSAPGGGVQDDAADGLRAASIVTLARHTAPGDRWWRGVHEGSVPHLQTVKWYHRLHISYLLANDVDDHK